MTIGILSSQAPEKRVAVMPEVLKQFQTLQPSAILIEKGAGAGAGAPDVAYEKAGGSIASRQEVIAKSDLLISIEPIEEAEYAHCPDGQVQIAVFNPLGRKAYVSTLQQQSFSTFSLDLMPRTTRAQAMDILSSQATAAGYKAVLLAAYRSGRFFPMLTTAAGSIPPSKILVLGAGVAGLQAIATARRLGAVVEAFDVRSAVREEVQSLGAKFVEVEGAQEDAAAGGYAVAQSEDYQQKQHQLIHDHAMKADVIICTAQIPGRKAPLLVPKTTVEAMQPGSIIVDMAASSGGNCEVSVDNETIIHHGVTVIGHSNLAATLPHDASKMFGKNVLNFVRLLVKDGQLSLNFDDDLVAGSCLTHQGEIHNEKVRQSISYA